jgi:hypothetical protein
MGLFFMKEYCFDKNNCMETNQVCTHCHCCEDNTSQEPLIDFIYEANFLKTTPIEQSKKGISYETFVTILYILALFILGIIITIVFHSIILKK